MSIYIQNNKIKEDCFNPRFEHFQVLVLDPIHMQCGLESGRETWATRLENGGLTIYVKNLRRENHILNQVTLYGCRSVIHIHAYRHYILTLGLHARGEC
jgi:hypothetical protein